MILIFTLDLIPWIQIMILKHAPRASFVDPILSLIKSVLDLYLSNSDLFSLRSSTLQSLITLLL
jgi:hypothetical protein